MSLRRPGSHLVFLVTCLVLHALPRPDLEEGKEASSPAVRFTESQDPHRHKGREEVVDGYGGRGGLGGMCEGRTCRRKDRHELNASFPIRCSAVTLANLYSSSIHLQGRYKYKCYSSPRSAF